MRKRALLLIGFAVLGLITALGILDVCDCTRLSGGQAVASAFDAEDSQAEGMKVTAYYFHGSTRCTTCRKIEAFSREAVQTGFSEALKTGKSSGAHSTLKRRLTAISSRTTSCTPGQWSWPDTRETGNSGGRTWTKSGSWSETKLLSPATSRQR